MTDRTDAIRVDVVLQAGLRKYLDGEIERTIELPAEATIGDLVEALGIAEEDVWVIGVNGLLARRKNRLADGDRVEFYEPVAGG